MPSPAKSTTPLKIRAGIPLLILLMIWLQETVDQLFLGGQWNFPMGRGESALNIVLSSFSHADFDHLWSNTIVFLPASWLVLSKGVRDYISVWICVIVTEGLILLLWKNPSHGLSDICFGLMGYLFLIGILERRAWEILLSVLAVILYGKFLAGLLPWNVPPGISWIGHTSGFLGGAIAALGIYREPNSAGSA